MLTGRLRAERILSAFPQIRQIRAGGLKNIYFRLLLGHALDKHSTMGECCRTTKRSAGLFAGKRGRSVSDTPKGL